jgi:digeranylgeranylglycerophospholipid reductase
MIVGDAARVVDPFTGGGIYNAMFTGKLAAETAVKAISLGDVSKKALMDYDTGWRNSSFGKHLARNWQIRKYFISLSDEKMNALIQSTAQMDLENFSTLKLIKEIMKRNPALVAELAAQITQGALKRVLGSERLSTIF